MVRGQSSVSTRPLCEAHGAAPRQLETQLWNSAETLAWKNMFRSLRHLARKERDPPRRGNKARGGHGHRWQVGLGLYSTSGLTTDVGFKNQDGVTFKF